MSRLCTPAAEVIAQEFTRSEIDIEEESIDMYHLGLYLVLTMSDDELNERGWKDYCPTRRNTLGRKPTLTGQATTAKEKKENVWYPPKCSNPDESTRKSMVAKALEIGINAVMRTHVYKFAGETRAQKQGGAIGLELTGEIAGVFMSWWDRKMRARMEEEGVKVILYKRYVDDINLVVEVCNETEEKDAWERIKEIGNRIHSSIQLEEDYPANYHDQKVPILDIKVWVNDQGKIRHEYYSKSVSSKAVIDARSAMPRRDKRAVLTQDLLRILLRCSPELEWEMKKKHVEEYVLRLQFSGYQEGFRREIVKSALNAYEKIKRKVEKGERPMYRTKVWKQKERSKEKRTKKTTWYKSNESQKDCKSVLFVQPTKDSVLKRKYEDVISKSKCKVKVIERAGVNISQKMQKSYPFEKVKCTDSDCFVCNSEGKGNCAKENINYEIECVRDGCDFVYYGESARNALCRGREHLKGIRKKDKDSAFVEHIVDKHENIFDYDLCGGFKMSVKETHKNAFDRVVTEAVKISMSERPVMNRKSGFRTNSVLRLSSSLSAEHTC